MARPTPFYQWRPHPWHGLDVGESAPAVVNAYIEITSFDTVKYEVDKETGYLVVDRPQASSSLLPCPYGFIPRTYCSNQVKKLCPGAKKGDKDPLDICVITERRIERAEVVLRARVIGVIKMIDDNEADDKIIAVLDNDQFWKHAQDITDIPDLLIHRLKHYFDTYKMVPDEPKSTTVEDIGDAEQARQVVNAAIADYKELRKE